MILHLHSGNSNSWCFHVIILISLTFYNCLLMWERGCTIIYDLYGKPLPKKHPVYHFYAEIGDSSTLSLHWWTMWTIQSLKNSVKVQSIESAGKVLKAIPGGIMYAALRGHPTNALALTNN